MMTSGWSKVDFQLSETMLVLSPSKPMLMPHLMPLSSLLHHIWSGWFDRYLQKLLRCCGDFTTRTTLGSRVLLLTDATGVSMFAVRECAPVLLVVITALSSIMESFICLYGWGGLKWTWLSCLPYLYALLCCLCHLHQGSPGKGTCIY